MKRFYDLHLHSCLSPCGDNDMTPNNLVNMAKIMGLDLIALTDHNSTRNCRAAVNVGESIGLTVVPGMELCTAEEIHVICLFPDCDAAEQFGVQVETRRLPIANQPSVFGDQRIMNEEDQIIGEETTLLVAASTIGLDEVPALCHRYGGICYPAHIDRSSYSILSVLGEIPSHLKFSCAEVSFQGDPAALRKQNTALGAMHILCSSDAHYLENIAEAKFYIDLENNSAKDLIQALSAFLIESSL